MSENAFYIRYGRLLTDPDSWFFAFLGRGRGEWKCFFTLAPDEVRSVARSIGAELAEPAPGLLVTRDESLYKRLFIYATVGASLPDSALAELAEVVKRLGDEEVNEWYEKMSGARDTLERLRAVSEFELRHLPRYYVPD